MAIKKVIAHKIETSTVVIIKIDIFLKKTIAGKIKKNPAIKVVIAPETTLMPMVNKANLNRVLRVCAVDSKYALAYDYKH